MIIILLTLFVISIILLIPTILLQTSGADNGIMSSNITAGAFGARSNEILVKFTSYCIVVFLCTALLLSIHYIRLNELSGAPVAPEPNVYNEVPGADQPALPPDVELPIAE